MIVPRDYQVACHEALWRQVHEHPDQNPLVIQATGLGKSLQIAMFVYAMLSRYPHLRMMMVTHVKELVKGNYDTLRALWPSAPVGIYSAGLGVKDTRQQVTYAGIASVARKPESFRHIDFLLIDEAHRISDKDNTLYLKFIAGLRAINPNLIVIGFTATAYRMTTGLLVDGELFDTVCFNIGEGESFVWAIENAYLMKLIPKHPGFQLDDSSVSIVAGDFSNSEASKSLRDQNILERAVDTTIAFGLEQNRQSWLTFAQSIEDAELLSDMFRYKGHEVLPVHSKRDDRDEVLDAFRKGKIRGVTNQNVLTTGFDNPKIDLITMLRLTRSPGLWVQMLGRGTRPAFAHGYDIATLEGRRDAILAGPKQSCVLRGSLVMTDRGEVPIEEVKITDLIWDGIEYVKHGGAYAKGTRNVITYQGLSATPDHRVWSGNRWITFGEAKARVSYISKAAILGHPIQEFNSCLNLLSRCWSKLGENVCDALFEVWNIQMDRREQYEDGTGRLAREQLLQTACSSKVDRSEGNRCTSTMHQPKRFIMGKIWRAWDTVSVRWSNSVWQLSNGARSFRCDTRAGNGPDRQQWSLRKGKRASYYTSSEFKQQAGYNKNYDFVSSVYAAISSCKIRGSNALSFACYWFNLCRDRAKMVYAVKQTKGEVWDIHNSGPRHRFTCQGLIVSNCLVLDFVGNTERLGAINYPNIPKRRGSTGDGSPPTRLCPQCGTYHHISIKVCTECGYIFPPPERLRPEASESELVVSQTLDLTKQPPPKEYGIFDVHQMICAFNAGRNGKPDTMRVDYFSGVRRFSTWVCFEHPELSFPRRKACEWWRDHGGDRNAVPTDCNVAIELAADLAKPKFIRVWVNNKYPEIVGYDFRGTKFELPPELGGPPLQEPGPNPLDPKPSDYGSGEHRSDAFTAYFSEEDIPF